MFKVSVVSATACTGAQAYTATYWVTEKLQAQLTLHVGYSARVNARAQIMRYISTKLQMQFKMVNKFIEG